MNSKIKSLCTLPIPYPQINVAEKNPAYARMLSVPYAGQGGELASLLSYTYGHIVTEESDGRLSDVLECVAMTEMRHVEILGKLIFALGGDPRYCSADARTCFSAQTVPYNTSPERIIRAAIMGEQASAEGYRNLAGRINDRNIKDILERLAVDEEHHVKIFSELMPGGR